MVDNKLLEGYLTSSNDCAGLATAALSFKGWERHEELKRSKSDSQNAFMAMKFGNDTLDTVYNKCFKNAVEQTGFKLKRLDEEIKTGVIDNLLRVEIRKSKFLVADLTENNHGVYWEAGFAEGLNKPVIYTCEKKYFDETGTHFDTNHCQTIIWEDEKLEDASKKLKATIRNTFPVEAKLEDE